MYHRQSLSPIISEAVRMSMYVQIRLNGITYIRLLQKSSVCYMKITGDKKKATMTKRFKISVCCPVSLWEGGLGFYG